jgi:hypothetical protein
LGLGWTTSSSFFISSFTTSFLTTGFGSGFYRDSNFLGSMTSVLRGLLGLRTLANGLEFSSTTSFLISLLGADLMNSAF